MISSALFMIFKCVLCTCTTFDRVACDSHVVAKCVPCKCAIFMDLTCGATFVTTFYCMKFKPLNLGCVAYQMIVKAYSKPRVYYQSIRL